jgi:hypothetical protein
MSQSIQEGETAAILQVVAAESAGFWQKDFVAWAACWLHAPYTRTHGWWTRGGISVVEGWEAQSAITHRLMEANPVPNPTATAVRRENVNLHVHRDMTWLTFDQYGGDMGEPAMHMPGISHETRILEKQDGVWKLVYSGWLLRGDVAGSAV